MHYASTSLGAIAYFSMEVALRSHIPTYSGGLGVLAGDTLRSADDMSLPVTAVSLVHRKGYFFQRLDAEGHQREDPVEWPVEDFMEPLPERATVEIEGRAVAIRAWRYRVRGVNGNEVPVIAASRCSSGNSTSPCWRRCSPSWAIR